MLIKWVSANIRNTYSLNEAIVLAFIKSMCKANERNERTEFQDGDGNWWCYCKVDGAEELIGLSKSAASRALKKAEEHGLIKSYVHKGLDHTKHYTLTEFGQSESRGASIKLQVGNRKPQELTENKAENTNSHPQATEFPHEFPQGGKSLNDYNNNNRMNDVIISTTNTILATSTESEVNYKLRNDIAEQRRQEVLDYWFSHGVFIGRDIDSMSEAARQSFFRGFVDEHQQEFTMFMSISEEGLTRRFTGQTDENAQALFMDWYDSSDRVNMELESKTA